MDICDVCGIMGSRALIMEAIVSGAVKSSPAEASPVAFSLPPTLCMMAYNI